MPAMPTLTVRADESAPLTADSTRRREASESGSASTTASASASPSGASSTSTLAWPKRRWRQDRYKTRQHCRRVAAIERLGFSATLAFTCEPVSKFLAIEIEPSDEGFIHLLRPVARQAYAECGWKLHISIGHAACPLSQELWESFCADWSSWNRGCSYHFSVDEVSCGSSAMLSPTYILQDWRIQLLHAFSVYRHRCFHVSM